jgi:type IV secretion system protein VirB3
MVETDTLFVACTRPALRWGVPFEGFIFNVVISFLGGALLGSPIYWLAFLPIHMIFKSLASVDHNFFRVYRLWLETRGRSVGGESWGAPSLAAVQSRIIQPKDIASSV